MSENRDMLDDLIDIREDLSAVSNPLGKLLSAFTQEGEAPKPYNPRDYKEVPRPNSVFCLDVLANQTSREISINTEHALPCTRCMDVCPVDAIEIKGNSVSITESCRMCGLCTCACPTEAMLVQKLMAKSLYDKIARAASMYECCYMTCTRALGRKPHDNEILLPCVGAVPFETWVSLLSEYDNIYVYLPVGICDRCKTTTGEAWYIDEIGAAEEVSGKSLGLVTEADELTHELLRSYKRKRFVGEVTSAGKTLLAAQAPMLTAAQAVAKKIQDHSNSLYELQVALENAVGDTTLSQARHLLTQKRKLLLATIQKNPSYARACQEKQLVPVCDMTACTSCSACVRVCPEHACSLDNAGRFSCDGAYCINCAACALICPEKCLVMKEGDTNELIVRDEEAARLQAEAKRRKAPTPQGEGLSV